MKFHIYLAQSVCHGHCWFSSVSVSVAIHAYQNHKYNLYLECTLFKSQVGHQVQWQGYSLIFFS